MTMLTSMSTAIFDFAYTGVLPGTAGRVGFDADRVVSAEGLEHGRARRAAVMGGELRGILAARARPVDARIDVWPSLRGPCTVYVAEDVKGWSYRARPTPGVRVESVGDALAAAHAIVREGRAKGWMFNVLLLCADGIWRDRTPAARDEAPALG